MAARYFIVVPSIFDKYKCIIYILTHYIVGLPGPWSDRGLLLLATYPTQITLSYLQEARKKQQCVYIT